MPRARRQPEWTRLSDEALLDVRFCDLGLRVEDSPVQDCVDQLYYELAGCGLRLRPHCWFGEEWFSPDGVPGIAIPFYLAHPRLKKLQQKLMFEVEGGTVRNCLKLLRHEAGHAIDSAWRLHNRRTWQRLFGDFRRAYPDYYSPRTGSKHYVLHLDWWYAQSHPAEDFAETFAVWLKPSNHWRRDYAGWPALKKLEYVDELMTSLQDRRPLVRRRERVDPVARLKKTLREHYRQRRQSYGIAVPELFDADLRRLFAEKPAVPGNGRKAAALLRRLQPELCRLCARWTGEYPYAIAQIMQEMMLRCRELKLYVDRPEAEVKLDIAIFLSVQTLNYLHHVRHRIPM